jgi:multimeric flavodoxin WrbA
MQALLLDGSRPGDDLGALRALLEEELLAAGWEVRAFTLRDLRIAPCTGCFGCWIRTPGLCTLRGPEDDEEILLRAMLESGLVVWLTPIVFGGYSAEMKAALDRWIPMVLPFFAPRGADHRHPPRYEHQAHRTIIGVLAAPDAEAEGIFHRLVHRNALNEVAEETYSTVAYQNSPPETLRIALRAALPAGEVPA